MAGRRVDADCCGPGDLFYVWSATEEPLVIFGPSISAALVLLAAYLLGSVPFGLLLTWLAGAGDLRSIGSGNIGATNVLRTGRKGLAVLTLLLDMGKGAAAVLIAGRISPDYAPLAAVGVFFGHLYPLWLGFRGGKGVATMLGLALALHWPCGVAFGVVWLLAALVTRYSSVGGMAGAIATPVSAAAFGQFGLTLLFLGLTLMVLWKHRGNLERLLAGTEPRIGAARFG
jgi:acyl phosphate:glycerol-3-phosphate acyltransferase